MNIVFDPSSQIFKIDFVRTSYVMKILSGGILAHLYFGSYVKDFDLSYLIRLKDRGFSGNPAAAKGNRGFSMDTLPQEMGSWGVGDYRMPTVVVQDKNGATATDFRYLSYQILPGKPGLRDLPATYGKDNQCMTLVITMKDPVTGLLCDLQYSIFNEVNGITRSLKITNPSDQEITLKQAFSMSLDVARQDLEMISLHGRWACERNIQRIPLHHGKQSVGSVRGASSHHYNPFLALVEPNATETQGRCWGFSLVYSGNFLAEVEVTQTQDLRMVMGIHPADFSWILSPEQSFQTPEVVMIYSDQGIGGMSQAFHFLYREHLCQGEYKNKPRPILINNWEATYFDFTKTKLLALAKEAQAVGIEMLVLDDGWFGNRQDDTSSLGDWEVNEAKMQGTLSDFVQEVNQMGLKVGLWFEPEMISENSKLYQAHPDWCLQIPGRYKQSSRSQLVLDLSRSEIRDFLVEKISSILKESNIEYVKWDMNRHLSEVWSLGLSPRQQGECYHRYVLGVYALLEKITTTFPHILFEGCSGGGGRFDPGMLYYAPQHWTSDNTDAVERLFIQEGTSLVYPLSSMSAHVSASPNHQTGRKTSLETRGVVAFTGSFGYELDLIALSLQDKLDIQQQIKDYKKYQFLLTEGVYHRLLSPQKGFNSAWSFVAKGKEEVLVCYVQIRALANAPFTKIRLVGLESDYMYVDQHTGQKYAGDVLMNVGLWIPELMGDGMSYTCHLLAENR